MKSKILLSILIVNLLQFARGDDYLKEPPSFLKSCHAHGSDFDSCFSTTLQNIFTNWKDGIPGLSSFGSIDPMNIKKIKVSVKVPNLADMNTEFRNMVVKGISQIKVSRSAFNNKDHTFKVLVKIPKMSMDADYKLKGSILRLNLDGHGKGSGEFYDLDYFINVKTALKKVGDEHFFSVSSVTSDVKNIAGLKIYFHDLFGDNIELEKTTNQLFNENWREFFEIIRPTMTEVIDTVMFDRFKKILKFIPARFFIADLQ